MSDVDKWIDIAKDCKYLPENDLKVLSPSVLIVDNLFLINLLIFLFSIYLEIV